MHHSMLPLIISCTRSWNFAWHLLWRSTTEGKDVVKFLAISQTIHTKCAATVCFTQCTLFFRKVCFLLKICLPCVICGTYVSKINAVLWRNARQSFASLALFTWLVYVRTYCVPIASLNKTSEFGRSGRKNVMSMRELFCPDPLAGFEKIAGFQIFYCLKIKCFHS